MNDIIAISDQAAEQIKKIIADTKDEVLGVLVGVDKSGCSGYSYKLDYAKVENTSNFEKILIFLTQLGASRSNGRTKGRAFLDFLRKNFGKEATGNQASPIILPG